MYICTYIYTYIRINIYIYIYIYRYTHTYVYTHIYTYIHTRIYIYIQTYTHIIYLPLPGGHTDESVQLLGLHGLWINIHNLSLLPSAVPNDDDV
jgi:hypothetical protein